MLNCSLPPAVHISLAAAILPNRVIMTATIPSALPCASRSSVPCLEDEAEDLEEFSCQASDPSVSPADFANWVSTQSKDELRRVQAAFRTEEWGPVMDRLDEAGTIEKMSILLQQGFSADYALLALSELDPEAVNSVATDTEHSLYATTLKAILQFHPAYKVARDALRHVRKRSCEESEHLLQQYVDGLCRICCKSFCSNMIECATQANHPTESARWFYFCCVGLQDLPSSTVENDAFIYTCWSCSTRDGAKYPYGEVPAALHEASFESCNVVGDEHGSKEASEEGNAEPADGGPVSTEDLSDDEFDAASDVDAVEENATDDESYAPESEDESDASSRESDAAHSAESTSDEESAEEEESGDTQATGSDEIQRSMRMSVDEGHKDALGSNTDSDVEKREAPQPLVYAASTASRRILRLTQEQEHIMDAFLKARCRTRDPAARSRGGPLWEAFEKWRSTLVGKQHAAPLTQLYFYSGLKARFGVRSGFYTGVVLK